MDQKFLIPSIAAINKGEKNNLSATEQWKTYFQTQQPLRTITDEKIIEEVVSGVSLPTDSPISFVVLFPLSFRHLHDFLEQLKNSAGIAVFLKDGNVALEISESRIITTYTGAWQEIVNRTTGKDSLKLIPEVITGRIEDIEKLKADHVSLKERLQRWVDAFNKLPGVRAEIYRGDVSDRFIEVTMPTSPPSMGDGNIEDWELNILNSVDVNGYSNGEACGVYEKWRGTLVSSKSLTWQEFYDYAVKLSFDYSTIPELKKI